MMFDYIDCHDDAAARVFHDCDCDKHWREKNKLWRLTTASWCKIHSEVVTSALDASDDDWLIASVIDFHLNHPLQLLFHSTHSSFSHLRTHTVTCQCLSQSQPSKHLQQHHDSQHNQASRHQSTATWNHKWMMSMVTGPWLEVSQVNINMKHHWLHSSSISLGRTKLMDLSSFIIVVITSQCKQQTIYEIVVPVEGERTTSQCSRQTRCWSWDTRHRSLPPSSRWLYGEPLRLWGGPAQSETGMNHLHVVLAFSIWEFFNWCSYRTRPLSMDES